MQPLLWLWLLLMPIVFAAISFAGTKGGTSYGARERQQPDHTVITPYTT